MTAMTMNMDTALPQQPLVWRGRVAFAESACAVASRRFLGVLLASGCMSASAQLAPPAQPPLAALPSPAQQPLLSRAATGVAPNVLLTMDDSFSMRAQYVPEGVARIGPYSVTIPSRPDGGVYVANGALRFHPSDLLRNEPLVAGAPGSNNWRQAFLRSADTNPLYYNPEVRYQPWAKADGSRYPQAVFTQALIDPAIPNLGTLNLSLRDDRLEGPWCYGPLAGNSDKGSLCTGERQAFDAGLFYRLKRRPDGQFQNPESAASYVQYSVNTGLSFTRHPARVDCAGSATCTPAEERQNFANWFVYHRSRMLAAKAGVGEALVQAQGAMRLGWGRLSKPPGPVDGLQLGILESGVRDYSPARRAEALTWLYAVQPAGGTPLREAVQEVTTYLKSTQAGSAWTDAPGTAAPHAEAKTCRRAYHVLVTDGAWSQSSETAGRAVAESRVRLVAVGNSDGQPGLRQQGRNGREFQYRPTAPFQDDRPNMLADFAMEAWKSDLQPSMANDVPPTADNPAFWQHLTHFTVGFGVGGRLDRQRDGRGLQAGTTAWALPGPLTEAAKIDDLWHAAVNSRGEYYAVSSSTELATALSRSVSDITSRELMEAGVATASTTLEANNRKYVPSYRTVTWSGDVEAFHLDARGQGGARAWSARQRMPGWQQRNIFTWDTGRSPAAGARFEWAALSGSTRGLLPGGTDLVDYIRGDRRREQPAGPWRTREHLLGDFVNSTPVLAAGADEPEFYRLPEIGESYASYVAQKRRRAGVLWVGGNAGVLHGFLDRRDGSTADGREVFAYVPRALLGKLPALAAPEYGRASHPHQFFVDGPLREADVHVPAPGESAVSWRNYLLGATGAGARAVFALDITDPAQLGAQTLRWEVSSTDRPELGHVFAPLAHGMLANGRWVALFGNGHGGASEQAVLFVVDIATGVVQELPVGDAGGNGLGGVAVVRNPDGQIERLYAGDLKGQLWRFDADATADSGFRIGLAGKPLFQADTGQPILQAPAVFPDPAGGHVVVVGTGSLVTAADAADSTVQSVYGLRDTASGPADAPLKRSRLESRQLGWLAAEEGAQQFLSLTGHALKADGAGWLIDLTLAGWSGLRVIYPVQRVTERFAMVSAVMPASSQASCEDASGRGINLLLPVATGLAADRPIFDTNGDGLINTRDAAAAGYAGNADGVDSILRGQTVPEPNGAPGGGCLQVSIQNTTGQMGACIPLGSAPTAVAIRDRVWRRILNPPIR